MDDLLTPRARRMLEQRYPQFLFDTEQPMCEVPFYHMVPKDLKNNLLYRADVLKQIGKSRDLAHDAWIMAARDPLWYVNTFCWIYEPRTADVLPFITYPFQDYTIRMMVEAAGKFDIGIEKSRDMGASWMTLVVADWFLRFHEMSAIGLVSRNEDAVDKTSDPDALMWKLDFLRKQTPGFLQYPEKGRRSLMAENLNNGSTISGYSATGNVARGGRKLFFVKDEFAFFNADDAYRALASTQSVTECRVFLSTPHGASGAFYDVMHNADSDMRRITLHWSLHPTKSRGLYASVDGQRVLLDDEYVYPDDYNFVLDGKLRSPWYDRECRRSPAPWLVAQELDLDYQGSNATFFDADMLNLVKRKHGRVPRYRGRLGFDLEEFDPAFSKSDSGDLKLWCQLDANNRPPTYRKYVLGADIAAGTQGSHSSNSAFSVVDATTGEEVATFASNAISPSKFAQLCVAVCKWFGNAMLVWEANGPAGAQYSQEIKRIDYTHVYYRKVKAVDVEKDTRKPGFWSDPDTKARVLGELARRLETGEFISHDEEMLDECRQYVFSNGELYHAQALTTQDDAGKGRAHGDRVIAAAMAVEGCGNTPDVAVSESERNPQRGSMAYRLKKSEDERLASLAEDW